MIHKMLVAATPVLARGNIICQKASNSEHPSISAASLISPEISRKKICIIHTANGRLKTTYMMINEDFVPTQLILLKII
jgi:hypothetical protein